MISVESGNGVFGLAEQSLRANRLPMSIEVGGDGPAGRSESRDYRLLSRVVGDNRASRTDMRERSPDREPVGSARRNGVKAGEPPSGPPTRADRPHGGNRRAL